MTLDAQRGLDSYATAPCRIGVCDQFWLVYESHTFKRFAEILVKQNASP